MKKICVFFVATLISCLAFAAFPIEGSWGGQQADNDFVFDMTMTVANGTVSLINVCSRGSQTARAQVSVPASYDASSLTVLGSAQDTQTSADGNLNCNVNAIPTRMNYVVQGDVLTLTQDGTPGAMVLMRR